MVRILCVCGARPNFMKVAPIMDVLSGQPGVETLLVHTGQHYDRRMSSLFFDELGIRAPDVNLGVGSGSPAHQTAEIMKRFEPVCAEFSPDWVVVVGDVNGTMAAAIVATKLGMSVAHVEAGLRSFDRSMPEEINRIVTDAVSDALFVSEQSGLENLRREGISEEKVHFVGNVMVDTLLRHRDRAAESGILSALELHTGAYALVTLHRPGNVDDRKVLSSILDALEAISHETPVLVPMHPRTRSNLERFGLTPRLQAITGLRLLDPLGYLDFVKLMGDARVVLTDSGGIQEETTVLGVACLTLRDNTERPVTLVEGTNRLVGTDTDAIVRAYHQVMNEPASTPTRPALWDGRAAERIVEKLLVVKQKSAQRGAGLDGPSTIASASHATSGTSHIVAGVDA